MPLARRLADGGASALLSALDHLLRQHDWARARLAGFAGRVVRVGVDAAPLPGLPPPQLLARVLDDGRLALLPWPGEDEPEAAVRMSLRPSVDAAFALLRQGPAALMPHLRIEGEAAFAAALGDIAGQLHWDVEEDLSRVVGDALARRIGAGVESGRATARDLRARAASSAVAHLAGDGRQLVVRDELDALGTMLDGLDARIVRLEAAQGVRHRGLARPAGR